MMETYPPPLPPFFFFFFLSSSLGPRYLVLSWGLLSSSSRRGLVGARRGLHSRAPIHFSCFGSLEIGIPGNAWQSAGSSRYGGAHSCSRKAHSHAPIAANKGSNFLNLAWRVNRIHEFSHVSVRGGKVVVWSPLPPCPTKEEKTCLPRQGASWPCVIQAFQNHVVCFRFISW